MKPYLTTSAKRLSISMQCRGISYGKLSKMTGIPKSALHRYATSETMKIPTDRIRRIADALNVSPVWLAAWNDENKTTAHQEPEGGGREVTPS